VCVVGVTGSAGKTTTKELIATVLETRLTGVRSVGPRNRWAAVGQTVAHTRPWHDFCVAEIGTSNPGDVERAARLLQPRIGVVTAVGLDHRKVFRTLEAIAEEKAALVDVLPADGVAVLNGGDPHVLAMAERCAGRVVTFGESEEADLRATEIRAPWPERLAFTLAVDGESRPVETRLAGKQWVTSVLAAIAVALEAGVPLDDALAAVARYEPMRGRMSAETHDGIEFVCDTVKAPIWSLDTVFTFLREARADRKVLVLGTLSDYAGASSAIYRQVARRALEVADEVVFVGPEAWYVRKLGAPAERLRAIPTVQEAHEYLSASLGPGDLVLLKGRNFEDHLLRIVLARTGPVACRLPDCGRLRSCERCSLLRPGRGLPLRPRRTTG
jgi:UDP-N-acetylmuramyl pentapeptide synthase